MAVNLGQAFAYAAVAVFLLTTVGSAVMWGIDTSAEQDDPYLAAKYADGGRGRAMGNYMTEQCVPGAQTQTKGCSDSVAILQAKIRLGYHTQRVAVMTETFTSMAYILALFAIWALRAHLKPTRQIDELEPIAIGCLSLGFIMQVLELSMMAGPRGYVNDVGMIAQNADTTDPDDKSKYSNFQPADWHALYHMDEAINKMFRWFDVTNYGLFAVGFFCLTMIASERAKEIYSPHQAKLGFAIAAANTVCFLLNMLDTTTDALSFLKGPLDNFMKLLMVAWFVLLGIGFGNAPTRSTMERAKDAVEEKPKAASEGLATMSNRAMSADIGQDATASDVSGATPL